MTAFLLAYEPAKRLARLNLDLNVALVNVRVLFEVIDSPATEPTDDDRPPLKITDGAARIPRRRISRTAPGEPTIRDMSFVAEPGRMTALVGPSGGGKSTVLNLILRFYEVSSGVITIDDQDIASVSRRSLRSQISYVSQDVFLFRATDPREHRIRPSRRQRGRHRRGRQGGAGARFHQRASRRATTRSSASAARACPAASASASPSRAR